MEIITCFVFSLFFFLFEFYFKCHNLPSFRDAHTNKHSTSNFCMPFDNSANVTAMILKFCVKTQKNHFQSFDVYGMLFAFVMENPRFFVIVKMIYFLQFLLVFLFGNLKMCHADFNKIYRNPKRKSDNLAFLSNYRHHCV